MHRYNPLFDPESVFGSKLYHGFYSPRTTRAAGGFAHYFWAEDDHKAEEVAILLCLAGNYYYSSLRAEQAVPFTTTQPCTPRLLVTSVPNPLRDLNRFFKRPDSRHALAKAQHSISHLAYMGLRSGALSAGETVGDQGFVHELAHYAHFMNNPPSRGYINLEGQRKQVFAQVLAACREVPGYLPRLWPLWAEL